jgi:hypothetical protein
MLSCQVVRSTAHFFVLNAACPSVEVHAEPQLAAGLRFPPAHFGYEAAVGPLAPNRRPALDDRQSASARHTCPSHAVAGFELVRNLTGHDAPQELLIQSSQWHPAVCGSFFEDRRRSNVSQVRRRTLTASLAKPRASSSPS